MSRRSILVLILASAFARGSAAAQPGILGGSPSLSDIQQSDASTADLSQADSLASHSDIAGAQEIYRRIIRTRPDSTEAQRAVSALASSYVNANQWQGASSFLEDVIDHSPSTKLSDSARRIYTMLEGNAEQAQTRASARWHSLQAQLDDIPWWNIFRFFERRRLKSDVDAARKDVDQITDIKLLFNPVYMVTNPAGMGSDTSPGGNANGSTHTPAPGSNGNAAGGSVPPVSGDSGNGNGSPNPSPTFSPADDANGTSGGAANDRNASGAANGNVASYGNGNGNAYGNANLANGNQSNANQSNANGAVAGNTNGFGQKDTQFAEAPRASSTLALQAAERAKAIKLLDGELNQILDLIPADKRARARQIIIAGGGYGAAGATPATTPTSGASQGPTPTTSPSTTIVTASPLPSPSVPAGRPSQSPSASVTPTASPTGTAIVTGGSPAAPTIPVASPVASAAPSPAATPAAPDAGGDAGIAVLQQRVVEAYRKFGEKMRAGDRDGQAAAQSDYMAAMQALRMRMQTADPRGSALRPASVPAPSSSASASSAASVTATSPATGTPPAGSPAPAATPATTVVPATGGASAPHAPAASPSASASPLTSPAAPGAGVTPPGSVQSPAGSSGPATPGTGTAAPSTVAPATVAPATVAPTTVTPAMTPPASPAAGAAVGTTPAPTGPAAAVPGAGPAATELPPGAAGFVSPATSGLAQPPATIGFPQPSASGLPVRVNPALGPAGQPLDNDTIRVQRGSFQPH